MKCVIIDDDVDFSHRLKTKLDAYLKPTYSNYQIEIINDLFLQQQYNQYDLIFLDIHLKSTNGIQLAKRIHQLNFHTIIIFVSSLNECVFDALATNPLFFIRKSHLDIDFKTLTSILDNVLKEQFKYFQIKIKGREISIYNHEVQYISVAGHDLTINTGHQSYTLRSSLNEIIHTIQDNDIIQVSKTVIVNLQNVISLKNNDFILKSNIKIHIGRAYKDVVTSQYQEFLLR